MIRLSLLMLLWLVSLWCNGQKLPQQTIILKDGTQVSGIIVSETESDCTVKLISPQVVALSKQSISQITESKRGNDGVKYFMQLTTSLLAGRNEEGNAFGANFSMFSGVQVPSGFRLGAGTGVESLTIPFMPVFAHASYHPFPGKVSPFLFVNTGYSFAISEKLDYYYYETVGNPRGGFLLNAGLGLELFTLNNVGFSLSVGYRFQRATLYTYRLWWDSSINEVITDFNRIDIKFGFIFK